MPETFFDFTHRDYRPDHEGHVTPKGVPLEFGGMTPQKAGALLCKCSRKRGGKPTGGKGGSRVRSGGKSIAGRK